MKNLHSETEPLALQMERGGTRPEKDEGRVIEMNTLLHVDKC